MNNFTYVRPGSVAEALGERGKYLAGGTNLLDHLKLDVESHDHLVDVRKLGLDQIEENASGLRIGAGVTNTQLAYDQRVRERYPALSKAILSGASPQLRNVATVAGNLLQRTRCYYFRDVHSPCNKREPGSGCSAIGGINRIHAILGTSERCIATHPSDMAVAMLAFDAVVHTDRRAIPMTEFYVSYGEDPARENILEAEELVMAIELPEVAWFASSTYVKARDRASYEFALASAAVAIGADDCRIVLGGVATMPWRSKSAEAVLKRGGSPEAVADAALDGAVLRRDNAFKIELCKRVLVKALGEVKA